MNSVYNWLRQNKSVYIGNAAAMRDFRVQLRGSKSAILFGTYLTLLIGTAMVVYSQAIGNHTMSIVDAQTHLQGFYVTIMGLLGGAICLIAPALSATTVVLEKQRQSLDLVFSAPVSPKYYLVGKMISSYRYIWMLLVLSLPVTAACVVLGGASWSDVLGAYALLSVQALVLCSLSLLISTVAPKPVSAVLWSYALCAPYLVGTMAFAESSLSLGRVMHTQSLEMPFGVAMSPFTVTEAAGSYTYLFGFACPNWLLAIGASLLVCKIAVLCAGAVLSPVGAKEPVSLRVHGLVYLLTIMGFAGYSLGYRGETSPNLDAVAGAVLNWTFLPLMAVLPFMTCFGFDGTKKQRPDGAFNFRGMFQATPSAALPYVMTLLFGSALTLEIGVGIKQLVHGGPTPLLPDPQFFLYVGYAAAFWGFFWATGRLTSTFGMGLRASRAVTFATFVAVCGVPATLLATLDKDSHTFNQMLSVWNLWIMKPMFDVNGLNSNAPELVVYTGLLGLMALAFSFEAERRLRSQLSAKTKMNERTANAA